MSAALRIAWPGIGRLFVVALCVTLLAKGAALLPGYSVDDFALMYTNGTPSQALMQGRFMQAVFLELIAHLGLRTPQVYWVFVMLCLPTTALVAAMAVQSVSRNRGDPRIDAAGAAIIAAYPYLGEYFAFRASVWALWLAMALLALYLHALRRGELALAEGGRRRMPWLIGAGVALLLSMSALQTTLAVAVCVGLAALACDVLDPARPRGWREPWRRNRDTAVVIGAVVVAYAIMFTLLRLAGFGGEGRGQLMSAAQVPQRLGVLADLAAMLTFRGEPLVSGAAKALYGLAIVLLLPGLRTAGFARAATALALLVLGFLTAFGLIGASAVWWPAPRTLFSWGYAAGLALVVLGTMPRALARPALAASAGLTLALAMHSSAIFFDQQRLNRWDLARAELIAYDVARMDGAAAIEEIEIGNRSWAYPVDLRTATHDLNISAFFPAYSVAALLSEATGRPWRVLNPEDEHACEGAARWPAPGAIVRVSTQRVRICL